jgi:tetratricopeptide (TPR) repeat protein
MLPEGIEPTGKDPKQMIGYLNEFLEPGQEALDRGEFDLALKKFTRLAEVDPMNPNARLYVANALFTEARYAEAAKAYRKVIEIDSTNSTAYFRLGNIASGTRSAG